MRCAAVILGISMSGVAAAQDSVTLSWGEFSRLYREGVERDVRRDIPDTPTPSLVTLDEAAYRFRITADGAVGQATFTGRHIRGDPSPIPLLVGNAVVASIDSLKGGTLLARIGGLELLPDSESAFHLDVTLFAPVTEDGRTKRLVLHPPAAIRQSLEIELPEGARIVSHPGLRGADGVYRYSSTDAVEVLFEESAAMPRTPVDIDLLSRIRLQGRRLIMTLHALPSRPVESPIRFRLPDGWRFLASSLPRSRVRDLDESGIEVDLPSGSVESFAVHLAREGELKDGSAEFKLPAIPGNTGREGLFVVEEPDDGTMDVAGVGLDPLHASVRLPDALKELLKGDGVSRIQAEGNVQLSMRRFERIETPEVVLDAVHAFSTFEEGGGNLTVLFLEAPPTAGPRLRMKSVEGAEIWSLRVNGEPREVYALEAGSWIIPLARGAPSKVELSWLRKGPRIGLHGRLDVALPAVGLPARSVNVGIAIPPRVQILSLEGDLTPASGERWPVPESFAGRRHYFTRAFDKGEGLRAALYYKEPVDEPIRGKKP